MKVLKNINLISISTAFIALLALFVSISDSIITRKHNEYSVTPILNISIQEINGIYGLFLSNQGYGPALIDSCVIFYKGERMKLSKKVWEEIFSLEYSTEPIDFSIKKKYINNGFVVRIGEDIPVWGATIDELKGDYKKIESSISNISMKIYYHSIYNQKFTTE
ncbi:MAG: hypothetical protein ABSF81_02650 [Bacteroidales bacterium]